MDIVLLEQKTFISEFIPFLLCVGIISDGLEL